MDIYSYLNSKDIAAYCRKINHQFNAIGTAFIINACRHISLEEKPRWKSPERVVNTLVEIVAKGGNLVLGVGPTPEGLIQPEAVERLQSIGDWLKRNGKAIYNTVATPDYHDGNVWFTASKDGRTIYAIYMLKEGERLPATISWSKNQPKKGQSVKLVSNGKKVKSKVSNGTIEVQLPAGLKQQSVALEYRVK